MVEKMNQTHSAKMKVICTLLLALLSPAAWAMGPHGEISDMTELAALPAYCKGTQVTRDVSHDPKPIADYVAIYGHTYTHLHHYCWALNDENHSNYFPRMLDNIKYVMDKAPLTFAMLPEIYITKARILFKAKRDPEALATLLQLTQIKPDYSATYAKLGDYYQKVGDKGSAIRYYEQGLIKTNKKNADFFIFKIKKLDDSYKVPLAKTNESAQQSAATHPLEISNGNATSNPPDQTTTSTPMPESAVQNSATDQSAKSNPYCRFCP